MIHNVYIVWIQQNWYQSSPFSVIQDNKPVLAQWKILMALNKGTLFPSSGVSLTAICLT